MSGIVRDLIAHARHQYERSAIFELCMQLPFETQKDVALRAPVIRDIARRVLHHADANDTAQVFRIMRALNTTSNRAGYERLLSTPAGGRIAYQRMEFAECLTNPAYIGQFPAGSVGAAYARAAPP